MTDCILEVRTGVEDDGTALGQNLLEPGGRDLACALAGLGEDGVEDTWRLNPGRRDQERACKSCRYYQSAGGTGNHETPPQEGIHRSSSGRLTPELSCERVI